MNPGKHSSSDPSEDWRGVDWDGHTHEVALGEGVRVHYVDIGQGPGPAVLLVHGLGASWRVWLENIPALCRDHRVVAVDLPGFGDSPATTGSGSFAEFARILARLCAELDLHSVVVVGNSFGGWVSTELALRAPDLVVGLVLVDAAGIPATRAERIKVVSMMRMADRMAPLVCRYRYFLSSRPGVRRRAFSLLVTHGEALPAELALYLLPERPSPVFRKVLNTAVRSWSLAWCDRVAELDIPALVLWGELDRQLPVRHGEEWARLLRRSSLVVLPGAGHMPMLELPQDVNPRLRSFLEAIHADAS